MTTARTILAFAAALVVVPLAMRARESAGSTSFVPVMAVTAQERQVTAGELRAYFEGIQGASAVTCELVLSSFNSWSSSRAPDRDSVAWNVGMVTHRTIASEQLVPDLVAAMRSSDSCVSRAATRLLGRSNLESAKAALLTALRDDNAQIRQLAAIGIGFSDDSTATRPLVRALGDRDERVRAAVAWALGAVN